MKTYTKTTITQGPRLFITHDEDNESPRSGDGNIGLFFTNERGYKSPDNKDNPLYDVMMTTADEAKDTKDHIKRMKAEAHKLFLASSPQDGNSHDENLHVIDIYPVYKYEHSGVVYRRGTAHGFDYSNCGFYITTAKSLDGGTWDKKKIEKTIDAELDTYTKWANGEVYSFTLYDKDGEIEDSCGGYYDIDDIKKDLPAEWQNENLEDYFDCNE